MYTTNDDKPITHNITQESSHDNVKPMGKKYTASALFADKYRNHTDTWRQIYKESSHFRQEKK